MMGIIGGLLGALFNEFNTVISKYRMKHVAKKKASRLLRLVVTYGVRFFSMHVPGVHTFIQNTLHKCALSVCTCFFEFLFTDL